jgi:hypothetical protein
VNELLRERKANTRTPARNQDRVAAGLHLYFLHYGIVVSKSIAQRRAPRIIIG